MWRYRRECRWGCNRRRESGRGLQPMRQRMAATKGTTKKQKSVSQVRLTRVTPPHLSGSLSICRSRFRCGLLSFLPDPFHRQLSKDPPPLKEVGNSDPDLRLGKPVNKTRMALTDRLAIPEVKLPLG